MWTGDGGSAACPLQQGGRSFTGTSRPGRASRGLVCSGCSVRTMTASRRWRRVPHAWFRDCCPSPQQVCLPPVSRPYASVSKRLMMATTRSWWRTLVGAEAGWWCSLVPEFFVDGAGEIPVSWSDPDAVPPSSGTIPSWRASWEFPIHCTLRTGGNPRTGLVRAAASCRRRLPS